MKRIILLFASLLSLTAYAQETESLYLSGRGSDQTVLWNFFCTAGRNSGEWTKIPVPSNWEFEGFGQFTYGHDKERINETGIYRHEFVVPETWKGKTINIVFEGVMTDTEVKINGRSAGEMHQGGFYCFEYDITRLLKFGQNNFLEVTVHKSSSNESIENAERKSDFWVYGGIYRPVWLEALPKEHIDRTAIDAQSDGNFMMDVYLGGSIENAQVTARVKTLDGQLFGNAITADVNKTGVTRLSGQFNNPRLWSSEFPERYQVEVSLTRNGKNIHRVTEKFGFRTVALRPGDGFYVNGTKIKFKGVNRHTHWPTTGRATNYAISLMDALLIKEMNMNAVRMSHYPPDRHFLDICDSLGLYVIDELTGWQSAYDTGAGKKLVRELIIRDVNHPSIVMWANGNEGGFNFDLLPEYPRFDIQKRPVFHPWLEEATTNTHHYPAYGVGAKFLFNGNKLFFPTEFMHGLYDGGHGAGLDDFWNLMQSNPLSVGGFLWDLVDQGVVRNDRNNEMDTDGNHAADGIVGPYREMEGSFYTIKEIWSPVYLEGTTFLPPTFDGTFRVENRYHFTNLNQCIFTAKWVRFDFLTGAKEEQDATVTVPDISPGFNGLIKVDVPENMAGYDALYLTAADVNGREIYTWTRRVTPASAYAARLIEKEQNVVAREEWNVVEREERSDEIIFNCKDVRLAIDKKKGVIRSIEANGKLLSLANGPRFTSGNLILDTMSTITEDQREKVQLVFKEENNKRQSKRNVITLSLLPSGWVEIDYSFDVGGYHDHMGITFDYPEEKVKGVRWLGNGPYRVWKNRLKGVTFNIWEKAYNNTVTGESWDYPEFKGFHANLYAADLSTNEGVLRIVAASDDLFLHLFTPDNPMKRNNDNTLGKFPDGQLSVLNAISPVGTKFKQPKDLGSQSQQNYFLSSGHADPLKGKIYLKYIP
ncbi:MAG: glycosyl transferase family 2 [Bacteroidetes bacterium GWD2_45_23]|nr:MAG: glycosyl transferase family 2 [Bacteroidetes bacterium GWC2_46_850]OFX65849.1 MAG: glycosyl transferase family 2 [Bacteroidetes bacterium GWC1_47_7]OFX83929.1 MAG: glycosyl transferase family 2 [Bacteroidetes bacterium GWD2_45_23]HAR37367.1 glycoside hydrolase family 2 [Porphyromonadaceae bacterium]HBB00637.1 glycoside hydrolase family 2 [Porphyromonadaceae bacterium]